MTADLELLRKILSPDKLVLDIVAVEDVETLQNRSSARIKGTSVQNDIEVIAQMAWSECSTGGGVFQLPTVGDWVLVAYVNPESAFVVSRLSSTDDKIPVEVADDDDTAVGSKDGKNLHLYSDTAIYIGKKTAGSPPTEASVLGGILKTYLDSLVATLDEVLNILQGSTQLTTSPGNPTAANPTAVALIQAQQTALLADQTTYLTTAASNILSQHVFLERGGA